jgi:hypothetical protein
MRRPSEEASQVRFASGDELGDYAFHEMHSEDEWFVEEATDGRVRWEALPASHPLSRADTVRPLPAMPPPLPASLKTPMLSRSAVRFALVGVIALTGIGMVAMGLAKTPAAQVTSLANASPTLLPVPSLDEPARPALAPAPPAHVKSAKPKSHFTRTSGPPRAVGRASRARHHQPG